MCKFRVRWNEKSGQVWESGVHNHGPEAYEAIDSRTLREWIFLAKVDSFLALRRQYLVRKSGEYGGNTWFQCIAYRQIFKIVNIY
jgi:hypothetical protein